jgi:nicotinate-nucleotide adenylyltransferase
LGGVFDPVHHGHLSLAVLAKESFGLGEVIFIPSGTPPHKSSVTASPDDRLNMLKLALSDVDGCGIWEGEVYREGYSYTIDTLKELGAIHGVDKFYFIIGTDNLIEIQKWRAFEDIIDRVILCVAKRPGYDINIPDILTSANVKEFPGPEWGNSSTLVREYIKNGLSCKFLLPDAVIKYIKEKGLYGYSHR